MLEELVEGRGGGARDGGGVRSAECGVLSAVQSVARAARKSGAGFGGGEGTFSGALGHEAANVGERKAHGVVAVEGAPKRHNALYEELVSALKSVFQAGAFFDE